MSSQFNLITGLAIGPNGKVYIGDSVTASQPAACHVARPRILVFDKKKKVFETPLSKPQPADNGLNYLTGITADAKYVHATTDKFTKAPGGLVRYLLDGQFLWGATAKAVDPLVNPYGVATAPAPATALYVMDPMASPSATSAPSNIFRNNPVASWGSLYFPLDGFQAAFRCTCNFNPARPN